jgi:hypothetical protein
MEGTAMQELPAKTNRQDPLKDYAETNGLTYREVIGQITTVRGEVRSRRPQPHVVVKLALQEDDEQVLRELLGTPGLEFKIVAVAASNDAGIELHIRPKRPQPQAQA